MLAHQDRARNFMPKPALEVAARSVAEDHGPSASPPELAAHSLIGPYRIESFLGAGGMGVVYRAVDTKLNRPVAIKFLSADLGDAAARRRFQREAQMASSLNHPHILTIHDIGEYEGRQYLVTEFVDGGTLKDWARAQKRNWKEVVELLSGVADALAAAHSVGILHRDIKPANILVAKNGYAKLADFGLAKLIENIGTDAAPTLTDAQTRSGMILGTVAYMSPEQASGNSVDIRSDIFSFGVVLYELLARRRPFDGKTDLEVMQSIIHQPAKSLSEVCPDLPVGLRMAVDKALDKDPAERYQTARDLVVDLRRVLRQQPEASVPAHSTSEKRGQRVWQAIIVMALLLTAGIVARSIVSSPDSPAENPLANARFTRFTDFEGSERDAAISPDGKFVAFRADRDGRFDVWLSQVGTGRFLNLTKDKEEEILSPPVQSVGFSPDSSEIWLAGSVPDKKHLRLMPLMGGTQRNFLVEHAVNVGWSPDGARVAYHTGDSGDPVFVADRTGANAQQIFALGPGGHNHFPTWSPDGRWIYFVSGFYPEMDLWRIAAKGGTAERLTKHNSDVKYIAPIDNRTILYVAPDQDGSGPWLWALDVQQRTTRRISSGLERYTSISASADGRRLVASVANPSASLWTVPILDRLAEERDIKPFQVPTVRAWGPRFGANALFYLSSSGAGDGLWRYQNGETLEIWKGADGPLLAPAVVSRDGRRIAVVLRRQGKQLLYVMSSDGADLQLLTDAIDVRGAASWSPEGDWIVTGGVRANEEGLFKIPLQGKTPIRLVAGIAMNPAWSPDGSLIIYNGPAVAAEAPLLAVHPDGSAVELPSIARIRRSARALTQHQFLPGGKSLVYMQGPNPWQDFWLLDLVRKTTKPLTHFSSGPEMRSFDLTPDGKEIVFDRLRENSDLVLIDLPK